MEQLKEKALHFIGENILSVSIGAAGLLLCLYGVFSMIHQPKPNPVIAEEGPSPRPIFPTEVPTKIFVDVEGAVNKPGVHEIDEEGRIQDVLVAAGEMGDNADHEWVAKNVNLAAKVSDGMKIYVPFVGEVASDIPRGFNESVLGEATGLISINTATESELDTLPGVGKVTAEKIITNRPYARLDELLDKKAVGNSVFEKIQDKISL